MECHPEQSEGSGCPSEVCSFKMNPSTLGENQSQSVNQMYQQNRLLSWLFGLPGKFRSSFSTSWELYFILLIAAFLRLYRINATEFDEDQATIFRMAHDAIYHVLLPATSNIASIRIANPPGIIYLLMFPAALSPNPLWAVVMVGLFNTTAVLLTYLFTRRYFGRFAAIVATLLYATAAKPIEYSRFLWQQNMIAPFVLLFLFALYWGVVERRKGWLFPALLLLGIIFQLHEITILLIVPLLVALLLALGTLRLRDLALGLISLVIIFSTYLLWEISSKFFDLHIVLGLTKLPEHIDNQAILFYQLFLSPYSLNALDVPPTSPHSVLRPLVPILSWLHTILPFLVIAGIITALILILWPQTAGKSPKQETIQTEDQKTIATDEQSDLANNEEIASSPGSHLRISPYKRGLIVLLTWQIVPVLILLRHSVTLYAYYFLMLMPGPFILIGLFLSKLVEWFRRLELQAPRHIGRVLLSSLYILTTLLIIVQLVGSVQALRDDVNGNLGHGYTYNDLHSLQNALSKADQLAQQHHLNRVYIATDLYTQASLDYLAEQMHTPTTLFDSTHCLVLPNPADGPAVLLTGPADGLTNALLGRFANATLVDQPPRLGSVPFRLFIVSPLAGVAQTATSSAFVRHLQLLDMHVQPFRFNHLSWLVSRWRLLRNAQPSYRTSYNYVLKASPTEHGVQGQLKVSLCTFTSMRSGDRLLVVFDPSSSGTSLPTSLTITAQSFIQVPHNLTYGPFHFETIRNDQTQLLTLQTTEATASITLPVLKP